MMLLNYLKQFDSNTNIMHSSQKFLLKYFTELKSNLMLLMSMPAPANVWSCGFSTSKSGETVGFPISPDF